MELTQEIVHELLDYDPSTGTLTHKRRDRSWFNTDHAQKSREKRRLSKMSRHRKGPRCGNCKFLGAPQNDKGDRLIGKGGFRFPCLAPFDVPLKPAAFEVRIVKTLVTTADGEDCPAHKSIANFDKPAAPVRVRSQTSRGIKLADLVGPDSNKTKPNSTST